MILNKDYVYYFEFEKAIIMDLKKNYTFILNSFGKEVFTNLLKGHDINSIKAEFLKNPKYNSNDSDKICDGVDAAYGYLTRIITDDNFDDTETNKSCKILKEHQNNVAEERVLRIAHIEVETRCNYDCIYCLENGNRITHKPFYLSMQQYKNLFDDLELLGCRRVTFSGGEPFMNPSFKDVLELTKKYGFGIEIFTNLSYINNEYIDLLCDIRLAKIQVSFYGIEKDYDYFSRTKGHYNQVLRNLYKLKDLGLPIDVVAPLTKANMASFEYFKELEHDFTIIWNS